MFKKIDMFVFWIWISYNIIIVVLGALLVFRWKMNPNQVKNYGIIIFYAIIFFYKLKDKLFKIKYFLLYVFVSYIIGVALGLVLISIINTGRIMQNFSLIITITVLNCYLDGFVYQIFKKISHEEDNLIE